MLILSINEVLNWVSITTGGRKYTCPIKRINGELFFNLKMNGIKLLNMYLNIQQNLFRKMES